MKIDLDPEQDEFIRRAVETGRFGSAEEAAQDALALWIERERCRDELLAAIDEAETSLRAVRAASLPAILCGNWPKASTSADLRG